MTSASCSSKSGVEGVLPSSELDEEEEVVDSVRSSAGVFGIDVASARCGGRSSTGVLS